MWDKLITIFKIPDLRKKILFIFGILVVFRLAASIPVASLNLAKLNAFFQGNQLFGLLNIFTGGTMQRLSVVMLGLGPYITAVIILQLLTMIFPKLKEMYYEQGEQGRQKFEQYGRLFTVPLAALQAYAMLALFQKQGLIAAFSGIDMFSNIISITAGTLFLMWLGELITEKGLGNGVSILIFAGIVSRIPSSIGQSIASYEPDKLVSYIVFVILAVVIVAGITFITESQRNIPVSYAKRIRGRRIYGGATTYLPLRVNQAGVIPIIFALSIMLFPGMMANFFSHSKIIWLAHLSTWLNNIFQNHIFYGSLYFILVVAFTYFYTEVTFDPKAISENLQKQGGFIPGIRPGQETAKYLARTMNRVTLAGALFLGVVAVLPNIVQAFTGVTNFSYMIGGTAVLIVVAVILETVRQVKAQMIMRQYEAF